MVLLRAIPLSLAILWRMVLISPILLVVIMIYGALVGVFGAVLSLLVSPVLIALIAGMLLMGCSVTPVLVCLRVGLTLRDQKPLNSYKGLFAPSIGYGLIVGVIFVLVFAVSLGTLYLQSGMTAEEIAVLVQLGSDEAIWAAVAPILPRALWTLVAASVILISFYAAILVPLAGASIGRDTNGQRHTPFAGFGTGFLPLFILVAFGLVAYQFSGDLMLMIAQSIGLGDALVGIQDAFVVMADGGAPPEWRWQYGALIALALLFGLWLTCLQCAGAVLVYVDRTNRNDGPLMPDQVETMPRLSTEDVHALWKDRMPGLQNT